MIVLQISLKNHYHSIPSKIFQHIILQNIHFLFVVTFQHRDVTKDHWFPCKLHENPWAHMIEHDFVAYRAGDTHVEHLKGFLNHLEQTIGDNDWFQVIY